MRQILIRDPKTGEFVPKAEFQAERRVRGINIMSDIEPYRSPIDGKIIGSRSRHRDHMREHNVIEAGTEPLPDRPKPAYEPQGVGQDVKRAIEELGG